MCNWMYYVLNMELSTKNNTQTSVATVIETGTETAFFLQNWTEPKPRFYASVLTVRFWNGAALVPWTLTACKSSGPLVSPAGVIVGIKGEIASGGGPAPHVWGPLKRSARYWTARNWAARKRAARDREQPLLPMPPAQDQKTEPKPKSWFWLKTEPKPTDLSQYETVTTLTQTHSAVIC